MFSTSPRRAALALAAIMVLFSPVMPAQAAEKEKARIVSEDFHIPGDAPGLELFVRNKHPAGLKRFSADRTVLYIHGASLPSEVVLDLKIDGVSWADYIAARGFDVWLVDVRGYGRSGIPETVAKAGDDGKPFATTREAVNDLGTAIDFIRNKRKIDSLNLIAWSWGTVISGTYAGENPDRIKNLVLLGPPWVKEAPAGAAPPNPGPWARWTLADAVKKLHKGVPEGQGEAILPASTRSAWEKALIESQPDAATSNPAKFRSPTGVVVDGAAYWNGGKAYYDPGKIKAATLIVVGEWDDLTPLSASQSIFNLLRNARLRSLVEIPRGSHFLQIEVTRHVLYDTVQGFLERGLP